MNKLLAFGLLFLAFNLSICHAQTGPGWFIMPQPPPNNTAAVFADATRTNGTIIASKDDGSASQKLLQLFNNSFSGKWCVTSVPYTLWAVYQFGNGDRWAVTNYVLGTGDDMTGRDPAVWQVEGSNDLADKIAIYGKTIAAVNAATWHIVHSGLNPNAANVGLGGRGKAFPFDCPANHTAYNAYRLNLLQNSDMYNGASGGSTIYQLSEWQMFGNSGAAQLFWQTPSVTDIGHFSATLQCNYDKHFNDPFEFWVLCGTEDLGVNLAAWQARGLATKMDVEPGAGLFSVAVTNLLPRATQFARIYARSATAEAWSTAVTFFTTDVTPAVLALDADNIAETSAEACGKLVYADNNNADIWIHWGIDPDNLDHVDFVGNKNLGEFSFTLSPLGPNTTYYYLFTAKDSSNRSASSPWLASFTTAGAPLFADTAATPFSDAARLRTELVSAGTLPAWVSLWVGDSASNLKLQQEWSVTSEPQQFSLVLDNLAPDSVHHYAFLGSNETYAAWTTTNSFKVANTTLAWDNHTKNQLWDTLTPNWHPASLAGITGTTLFRQGSGVVIPANTSNISLAGNMEVENALLNHNGFILSGNHGLWFLRGFFVNNVAAALNSRLSGPGGLVVSNNVPFNVKINSVDVLTNMVAICNAANDFTGGFFIPRGTVNATLNAPAASVLGKGGVSLGQETFTAHAAVLNIARAAGSMTNATPGALVANGLFNSGRLNIADGTFARFGSIAQSVPGGTLALSMAGAGRLLLDNPPAGVFPPWFCYASGDNSCFAVCNNGAVVSANSVSGALAASGIVTLNGTSPSADITAVSAFMSSGHMDLKGKKITLTGVNGAAGLVLNLNLTNSVGGSVLDLCNNEFYLFNEGNGRTLGIPVINSPVLYKFGAAGTSFTTGVLPPLIYVQQGNAAFHNATGATVYEYNGQIRAISGLNKSGAGAVTLRGQDGFICNANSIQANDAGAFTLADGTATLRNNLNVTNSGRLDITNATVTTVNNIVTEGTGNARLNILHGGRLVGGDAIQIGWGTGPANITVNNGTLVANNWVRFGADGNANCNGSVLCVTNGASFIQQRTSSIRFNAGYNQTILVNGATLESLGIELTNSRDSRMDIQNGGKVILTGGLTIGGTGTNVHVRVRTGGWLDLQGANSISVADTAALPRGNALIAAGGKITAQNLTVNKGAALSPEIQLEGFGKACGLEEIELRGTARFLPGSIIRPLAVKGAASGEYCVLTATGGIFTSPAATPPNDTYNENDIILDASACPNAKVSWRKTGNSILVKYSKLGTLLMVK